MIIRSITARRGGASTLFIPGSITTAPQLGSVALTLTGSFGGGNTVGLITGNITEAAGTKLTVVKGGKGGWQLNGSNNFTGGLLVDSGSLNLSASGSALGKGSVTLGSAATGADAEINVGSYQTYYNALTIAAGQGTRRLVHLGSAWGIYAGSITMGKDLEIVNATGSGFHIGGKSAGGEWSWKSKCRGER